MICFVDCKFLQPWVESARSINVPSASRESLVAKPTNGEQFQSIKEGTEQESESIALDHNHSTGLCSSSVWILSNLYGYNNNLKNNQCRQFLQFSDKVQSHTIKRLSTPNCSCLRKVVIYTGYIVTIIYCTILPAHNRFRFKIIHLIQVLDCEYRQAGYIMVQQL